MTLAKDWYTVDEAAKYLGVSRRTIYKLTGEGRLAAFIIGEQRHRRFKKIDLDKVPQRQVTTKTPPTIALSAKEAPVLAELWNNDEDAIYDRL